MGIKIHKVKTIKKSPKANKKTIKVTKKRKK